jgi:hypothetical protein
MAWVSCGFGKRISAAVGTVLALGYTAIVAFAVPDARCQYSTLYLALVLFCINGLGFGLATDAAITAICRHQTILRAIRQADRHRRHATNNGFARVPLA